MAALQGRQLQLHGRVVGKQKLSVKSNVRKNGGRHQLGVTRQPRKQQLNVRKNGGRQQLGVRKNSGRHTLNVRKNAGGKQLRRVKSRCGTWHGVTRTT